MTVEEMGKLPIHSDKWFDAAFEHCIAEKRFKEASIHICRAYGIKGQADPAYIANVIQNKKER